MRRDMINPADSHGVEKLHHSAERDPLHGPLPSYR